MLSHAAHARHSSEAEWQQLREQRCHDPPTPLLAFGVGWIDWLGWGLVALDEGVATCCSQYMSGHKDGGGGGSTPAESQQPSQWQPRAASCLNVGRKTGVTLKLCLGVVGRTMPVVRM